MSELSLLIIDLGDSCVVKVEKGDFAYDISGQEQGPIDEGSTMLIQQSFSAVREAIDSLPVNKSVPRIEQTTDGFMVFPAKAEVAYQSQYFVHNRAYEALTKLAGVEIPVWKSGTWKQYDPPPYTDLPVAIWRFTR